MIDCAYLKRPEKELEQAPIPGPLGEYLKKNISQAAWQLWCDEQTRLINENRLSLAKPQDRAFLQQQLRSFFQITDG